MNSNSFIKKLEEIKEQNESSIQDYFNNLAKYLFSQLVICAGGDKYTFIEIEFYYHDDKIFNAPIYNCTYPRTCEVGKFFWHNSGVDICFDSKESGESEGFFGGILIRSLMKNGKEIVAGPMRCANELKNSCNDEITISYKSEEIIKLYCTTRYGIDDDKNQPENNFKRFCYFIMPQTWNRTKENVWIMDTINKTYKKGKKNDHYGARPDKRMIPKLVM